MGIDIDRLELLITYIERWLAASPTRNFIKLARMTGVTAPTIRRIAQRENTPELETLICLLNVVASPEESLNVLGNNEALSGFMKRTAPIKENYDNEAEQDKADEVGAQLYNRERFWCYMLGLTVGATAEFIEKICGSYGLYELDRMVEEKVLIETKPGRFFPTVVAETAIIKNKSAYSDAAIHIAEFARQDDDAQKMFMVYNVNKPTSVKIREICLIAYNECVGLAQANPGDIVIATSVLNAQVLGTDQETGPQVRQNHFRDRYRLDDRAAAEVAGVVHDMCGPFKHVLGFLDNQDASSDELKRAKNAAARVELMIDALRRMKGEEIVRRENGPFQLIPLLDLADCYAWDYKKTFTFIGQNEFDGYVDTEKLDRCLQNLLTNAFEAAHSMVRLECIRERDSIKFVVSDDGPGVPDDVAMKLFIRGFTQGKEGGTGLGLANVRAVAEGHQGEAIYERKEGLTVFSVILRNVFPDADLETTQRESNDFLEDLLECSELREIYLSEALQDKPILFLSCQDANLLSSLRTAAETQIPGYQISTETRDLSRAWVVCVDDAELALRSSADEVHRVWAPESKLMSHPAFMKSLGQLAEKELLAFQQYKAGWAEVFETPKQERV